MGSVVAMCMQQLESEGFTVVDSVLSEKQITLLARGRHQAPEFALIRRVFEGLPMRIMEGLAGPMVLSMAQYGDSAEWHRGRADTVASGAPADFIPGFDVAMTIDQRPGTVEAIAGSSRLAIADPVPAFVSRRIEFAPESLIIFDSRTLRRWPQDRGRDAFWFSVIRPWMTPLIDFTARLPKDTPPRAAQFAGRSPSRSISEWLFATHAKRSD